MSGPAPAEIVLRASSFVGRGALHDAVGGDEVEELSRPRSNTAALYVVDDSRGVGLTTLTSLGTWADVMHTEVHLEAFLPAAQHTADVLCRRWE